MVFPPESPAYQQYRIIKSHCEHARLFPEHADKLIEPILINPEKISGYPYDFYELLVSFPTHRDELIKLVLNNHALFMQVFFCIGVLEHLLLNFSAYKEPFGRFIAKNNLIYESLVKSVSDLNYICELFPDRKDDFLKPISFYQNKFEGIVKNPKDLLELVQIFPTYAKHFFNFVLKDLASYQQRMGYDVFHFIINTLPQYAEDSIKLLLANGPREWKGWISKKLMFYLGENFPQHAERFSRFIVSDPEEFNRLINNDDDLKKAGNVFPMITAFQAASIPEARYLLINENKIKVLTKLYRQAQRTNPTVTQAIQKGNFRNILFSIINADKNQTGRTFKKAMEELPPFNPSGY